MDSYTTPLTQLEAINMMLASIGEAPITTFSELAEQSPDAQIAQDTLAQTSRALQSEGWPFNTELEFPLSPHPTTGIVELPAGCVGVKTTYDKGRYVERAGKLYDRTKHTFNIGKTILADMIVLLAYDDLNQPARDLIAKTACRQFQSIVQGDNAVYRFQQVDIDTARAVFENTSDDEGAYNMLTHDPSTIALANRPRYVRR